MSYYDSILSSSGLLVCSYFEQCAGFLILVRRLFILNCMHVKVILRISDIMPGCLDVDLLITDSKASLSECITIL